MCPEEEIVARVVEAAMPGARMHANERQDRGEWDCNLHTADTNHCAPVGPSAMRFTSTRVRDYT